uniref:Methyltransferase domain-containing protein n=1 Tax=Anopheles farauti TaxID=69004 RepID=A0A182QV05_9DIPT
MEDSIRLQAELRQKILEAKQILNIYKPLIDAYIVDFYRLNHWHNLSPSWIRCFTNIPISQLPELLTFECRNKETIVWPLTVLALRSLFRRLVHTREKEASLEHQTKPICVYQQQATLFQKSVKLKKRHEIEQFAFNCFSERALGGGRRTLVDIGSGQGNLARTLAYGFGFRLCCLEQNKSFVHVARQKDAELWRQVAKNNPSLRDSVIHPVHLHETVNLEAIDPEAFVQLLRDALNIEKEQQPDSPFQFGLIGLHPCGDLGPSLLRLFLACPECHFVKLVCCCYMKLTVVGMVENTPTPNERGFPLSEFCRKANLSLSYEAREIACHAIEQYREKLLRADYLELKVHAYRAAIESIIVRMRPDLRHAGLKSGIKATDVSFEEYCERAVAGLGIVIPREETHSDQTRHNLDHWEEVVKFYTLRLMFAPLVETIILYDRLLFLLEQGANARIDVLFDPLLSPRNHVITAFK